MLDNKCSIEHLLSRSPCPQLGSHCDSVYMKFKKQTQPTRTVRNQESPVIWGGRVMVWPSESTLIHFGD